MNVDISPREGGRGMKIELDGHDVAHGATGFSVDYHVGERPRVTIDAHPELLRLRLVDADVRVSGQFHAALVALGWTPPKESR